MFVLLPSALTGCVIGVALTGGDFTLGSLVGFFAVFGIAARHSVLVISRYQQLEQQDPTAAKRDLISRVTRERFAPMVLTVTGAALALAPMLLFADTVGHELAHPLSVVVVSGLISTAIVTLVVLPALHVRFSIGHVRGLAVPETLELTEQPVSNGNGREHDIDEARATTPTTTATD
jgi:Cu/Ag efflux pump CusA